MSSGKGIGHLRIRGVWQSSSIPRFWQVERLDAVTFEESRAVLSG